MQSPVDSGNFGSHQHCVPCAFSFKHWDSVCLSHLESLPKHSIAVVVVVLVMVVPVVVVLELVVMVVVVVVVLDVAVLELVVVVVIVVVVLEVQVVELVENAVNVESQSVQPLQFFHEHFFSIACPRHHGLHTRFHLQSACIASRSHFERGAPAHRESFPTHTPDGSG